MARSLLSGILIAVLTVGIALPAEANRLPTHGELVGGLIGAIALVALITVVVFHEAHKKRSITGCVSSGTGGMTLIDKKDKRVYMLSGNVGGITAGDRVKLRGKKEKGEANSLVWKTNEVAHDFGVCHL